MILRKRNKRFFVALSILFVIILAIGVFIYLNKDQTCVNYECFRENMISCSQATYINEAPEATWEYDIKGFEGDKCLIDVRLLQLKEGDLDNNQVSGYEMQCEYPRGFAAYPEKDLTRCHGRLKEELQTIIIKKLHSILIENLGDFEENLNKAF